MNSPAQIEWNLHLVFLVISVISIPALIWLIYSYFKALRGHMADDKMRKQRLEELLERIAVALERKQ